MAKSRKQKCGKEKSFKRSGLPRRAGALLAMTYWLAVFAKIVIAKERSDCGNLMAVLSAYYIDMLLRLPRRIFSNPPRNDKQFHTSTVIAPQGHFVAAFSGSGASLRSRRGNPYSKCRQ